MNRAYALLIPIAFIFTACGPGGVGDKCQTDDDCDTEATPALFCDIATDATADADGTCQEVVADPTTP